MRNAFSTAFSTAFSAAFKNNILSRYFIEFSAAAGSHARVDTISLNAGDTVIIKAQMDAGAATRYLIDGNDANERCFAYISYTTQLIKLSSTRVDPNSVLLDGVPVTGDIAAPNDSKIHTLQFTVSQPCKIGYVACRYSVASFLDQIFMSLQVVRDVEPVFLDFDVAPDAERYDFELINLTNNKYKHAEQNSEHNWRSKDNILSPLDFQKWSSGNKWHTPNAHYATTNTDGALFYIPLTRPKIYSVTVFGETLRHYDGSKYSPDLQSAETYIFVNQNASYMYFTLKNAGVPAELHNIEVYEIFEVA